MAKRDPLLTEFERLVFSDLNKRKNVKKSKRQKSVSTRPEKTRTKSTKTNISRNRKRKRTSKNVNSKNKKSISQGRGRESSRRITGLEFSRFRSKDSEEKKPNCLRITFTKRSSFKKKIDLINSWDGKEIDYFSERTPRPIAIQTILTTKKGRSKFERASRFSDFSFHIDRYSTHSFILNSMIAYQDNYIEYIEDTDEANESDWVYNPKNIMAITVRFIYYKEPKDRSLNIDKFLKS